MGIPDAICRDCQPDVLAFTFARISGFVAVVQAVILPKRRQK
jgi:hypothetical protein